MEFSDRPRSSDNDVTNINKSNKLPKRSGGSGSKGPLKMAVSAFFAAVAVLALTMFALMTLNNTGSESKLIKSDKYQAVFLSDTSGQVYFGKLKSLDDKYYELTDIFYVKVENAVQPDTNNTAAQNISLAKLGNELHGPEDVMYISKDKVLFWENLKDDGQVVKAITEFKKNGSTTTNTQSSQTQTQNQSSTQNSDTNSNTTNQQNTTNQNSTISR